MNKYECERHEMHEELKNNEKRCKCGFEFEQVLENICEDCLRTRIWAGIERDQPNLSKGDIDNLVSRMFRMINGKTK